MIRLAVCAADVAEGVQSADFQPQRIRRIQRIIPGVGVGLARLVDQGIDGQELAGGRIVVTPY